MGTEINTNLKTSRIILLLASPDYLASDYCYGQEMQEAVKRYLAGEACGVIPVILRPADWQSTYLGKLQALPKDGKPVTRWTDQDEAFLDIAKGVRKAVEELTGRVQVYNPPSERLRFIDTVKQVAPDAQIFGKEFTQSIVIQISSDLSDAQFNALYSLGRNYRPGSQGITKSLALEQIGGKHWEAAEIFEALVRFEFLVLSTDRRERDHPDPGYAYTPLFFGFRHLMECVEKRGDPEADWWLSSPNDPQAEERYKMEINRQLSEMAEQLKQRTPGIEGEGLGGVIV